MSEYERLIAGFRSVTHWTWPETGRCCLAVRDGAPECCYQIADGAELTFTITEWQLLDALWGEDPGMVARDDHMFVLDRSRWTPDVILDETWRGRLADTLECASHPTRPVIEDGHVRAVAVLQACNGPLAMSMYRAFRPQLLRLWEHAVHLVGVKPYYCTEFVREDMIVL